MSESTSEREFVLPAGSLIKINGWPYWLRDEATVSGFREPERPKVTDDQSSHGENEQR